LSQYCNQLIEFFLFKFTFFKEYGFVRNTSAGAQQFLFRARQLYLRRALARDLKAKSVPLV